MRYLCLAYEKQEDLDKLSQEEWTALREETLNYVDSLEGDGRMVFTRALKTALDSSCIRRRNGSVTVTDGPFIETKEQLGGFFMIEAKDHNEAIQIASHWPSARFGTIEVRPVQDGLPEDKRY